MLSSRIKPDDDDDDRESSMPGDYEPMGRSAERIAPPRKPLPVRPTAAPTSRSRPRPPSLSPTRPAARRQPTERARSPIRARRARRRSLTPQIVIDRRNRRHGSSRRGRVIRIPLDDRPTLGLRGPPTQILELERVRCRRRRRRRRKKHRSHCHEPKHNDLLLQQPPSNIIMPNPMLNPSLPLNNNQNSFISFLSNLTPQAIERLPKQTVHLPPIHLPGSQANTDTELNTVIFPAELINPIDGTLSVIQANPTANAINPVLINSSVPIAAPTQQQIINVPAPATTLQNYVATASDPFLRQLEDLVQRVTLSQAQSTLPSSVPQSSSPPTFRMDPAAIRPATIPNHPPTYPSVYTPASRGNTVPYRLPTNTSFQSSSNMLNRRAGMTPSRPNNPPIFQPRHEAPSPTSDIGPYRPANITPYNAAPNRSVTNSSLFSSAPPGMAPRHPPSSEGSYSHSPGTNTVNTPTPYRLPDNFMPRSILRNGTSNTQVNTTYTRLNPASVSSTQNNARKKTTFA
ncbi:unnamed protein product [Adineta ricciae]|uniref:Uncharacterized protein n=1 Tax=Adineta ricciae TaxID=249248 RepID=A0A813WMI8_ADIRI|nr:unnamed protein product [Adineta ricciae]CAF1481458.1 unnamed protein product [Adineta ricciae]